jgi:hypothetical protein
VISSDENFEPRPTASDGQFVDLLILALVWIAIALLVNPAGMLK